MLVKFFLCFSFVFVAFNAYFFFFLVFLFFFIFNDGVVMVALWDYFVCVLRALALLAPFALFALFVVFTCCFKK